MPEPSLSYNPAANITLPGVGPVELKGLILVVGPNSSGKTQFLTDIRAAITGQDRKCVVCEEITLKPPPNLEEFLAGLEHSRCLRQVKHGNKDALAIATWALGTSDKFEQRQVTKNDLEKWYKSFEQPQSRAAFMKFVGNLLVTTLFLQNRLVTTNRCRAFDHKKDTPKNDLQALHITSAGQRELNIEIVRAFRKSIAIDCTTTELCLRVFGKPDSEPPRCWPDGRDSLPIEQEGDGLRSFTAICLSLLAGHRPVCVIDEPELCLHPPQAHALGQFIGRHGSSDCRTTLVATHSSHVLRGVMETANSVQIIRLSRNGGAFVAHLIAYDVLMESINRPLVRAETVLDGVFADGVIVVESDGDRAVYQAALESATPANRFDILFVPVGGHGGIPGVATFYKRLKIPVAAIADLDLVLEQTPLRNILLGMAPHKVADIEEVIQCCDQVSKKIMQLPPPIDTGQIQTALATLAEQRSWETWDTSLLMNQLREMANKLDKRKVIKAGGLSAFDKEPDIKNLLSQIIDSCRQFGLFLVPVGELEYWAGAAMAGVGKRNKAEWANEAVVRITKKPDEASDVISFVHSIAATLEGERNTAGSQVSHS